MKKGVSDLLASSLLDTEVEKGDIVTLGEEGGDSITKPVFESGNLLDYLKFGRLPRKLGYIILRRGGKIIYEMGNMIPRMAVLGLD